jgi:purine-nucleoside phosphorylase
VAGEHWAAEPFALAEARAAEHRAAEHRAAEPFALAEAAAAELLRASGGAPPEIAVVLGSGWQQVADALGQADVELPFAGLPGFPQPSAAGHPGVVRLLWVEGRRLAVFVGRVHLYEGRSPAEVAHAVRSSVIAGAKVVVLTNASGALSTAFHPGEVALVRDQINLTSTSPLAGPMPGSPYPSRFTDLSDLYSARLREVARSVAPNLPEAVYAALPGPHYETPAEVSMLRLLGADLVGMSTALEAIAARHLGASVVALSLVSNLAAGVSPRPLDHLEVLAAGRAAAPRLGELLSLLLPRL